MHEVMLKSSRDALLLAVPLILLLLIGFFRLDEILMRAKKGPNQPKPQGEKQRVGRIFATEPDGTPLSQEPPRRGARSR